MPPMRFIIFCISLNWVTQVRARRAGSVPEPLAMRARREPSMRSGSPRSAAVIERMMASTRPSSRSSISALRTSLGTPGIIATSPDERAHLLDLLHLVEEVVEGELPLEQLGGGLLGLVLLEDLLGLLDEGEHVAHAEDAPGQAIGVEQVEVVELLAGGGEGDGPAHDLLDRERGTAAGVAVELGEDDAVELEGLRGRPRRW